MNPHDRIVKVVAFCVGVTIHLVAYGIVFAAAFIAWTLCHV